MGGNPLSHLDDQGRPRMVDVGEKPITQRVAIAEGEIRTASATLMAVREGRTSKGDVLQVAQIAGVMASKRTAELIPLCHPLPISSVEVEIRPDPGLPGFRARATVRVEGKTGVEMEALTAVSCALLTIYDMCKAVDRGMQIERIRLVYKEGGQSGMWRAEP